VPEQSKVASNLASFDLILGCLSTKSLVPAAVQVFFVFFPQSGKLASDENKKSLALRALGILLRSVAYLKILFYLVLSLSDTKSINLLM